MTVVLVRADASSTETSEHAATLAIWDGVGDGDGVGLVAAVDGAFDEPHAQSNRPADTVTASAPLDRRMPIMRQA